MHKIFYALFQAKYSTLELWEQSQKKIQNFLIFLRTYLQQIPKIIS